MKIVSIVTLVSPKGEYGGPLRVAINQARALVQLGHEVTLVGAYRGYRLPPSHLDGVPARLFASRNVVPATGFAGLVAPSLWTWLAFSAKEFDVAHIHVARDLVTLPAARLSLLRGLRYVLQPHGMIDPSARILAKPLDATLTKRVLKGAHQVLYLTDQEKDDLQRVAGDHPLSLMHVPNGVPGAPSRACGSMSNPEVLYLARLAPRKRPAAFVRAAMRLHKDFPHAKFTLVGPDEGEGEAVAALIEAARQQGVDVAWEGPISPSQTIDRMLRASVFVLPAVNEPYPMAVLEAMSVGLPVVITESCGLASFLRRVGGGLVVSERETALSEGIGFLLGRPAVARDIGEKGRAAVIAERSMGSVAELLERAYGV